MKMFKMDGPYRALVSLAKRIIVPISASTTPEQMAEMQEDPWPQAGQYALGWVYFCIVLLFFTFFIRLYHIWGDKLRTGLNRKMAMESGHTGTNEQELQTAKQSYRTSQASMHLMKQSSLSTIKPLNKAVAFARWIFYRPIPVLKIWKIEIGFPSLAVTVLVLASLVFVTLYCFVPQPLFYSSISYGSPPLAIRAGMISVAMVPWIVALGTKANLVSMVTGIGHERLNVLHRWLGYLCLFLGLVHTIPFYITPVWNDGALSIFQMYLPTNMYIYGSGLAALVPLVFLCLHSLPFLRAWMYELFVFVHTPVAVIFLAMLFWHCQNFLTSWSYLWTTLAIWVLSYLMRPFYLNWTSPLRLSFMIGEDSAVTLLPENAVKVTIPTQMRWRPGQYVYLRMPGIAAFENHPFTIASLCSDDFPSGYGPDFRDMALIFRPFRGFTRKVMRKAIEKGPYKIYRAFLDGPYGGMQREMAAFNDVIFFAGGSGITAIASQILNLIKKMRDGKAVTRSVHVIWALKRPEMLEWFKDELRICREYAPPNTFHCQFFLTGTDLNRPAVDPSGDVTTGMRDSVWIQQEAAGDPQREKELRRENEDAITALPSAHLTSTAGHSRHHLSMNPHTGSPPSVLNTFDFGFASSPSMATNTLTRFAFLPKQLQVGWQTQYGRPNIAEMLREFSKGFGRRACVFVCGPPSMRVEVANNVAKLQQLVLTDSSKDEIFLHAENYSI
jgi:predicted ferric reductase